MQQLITAATTLSLLWITGGSAALAVQKAVGKIAKPGSESVDKGSFHATVALGKEKEEFEIPAKALSEVRRAAGKLRRADDADTEFKLIIDLNGGEHSFSKPADGRVALKAVAAAMARARKAKIGFGEIGPIENPEKVAKGESLDETRKKAKERQKKVLSAQQKLLQARRIIQYRIQAALANELRRGRGGSRGRSRGRLPNPLRIQQIIQAEVNKAKQEGLLPDNTDASGFNVTPADLAKQAEVESIRQMLAKAFQNQDQPKPDQEDEPDKPQPAGEDNSAK